MGLFESIYGPSLIESYAWSKDEFDLELAQSDGISKSHLKPLHKFDITDKEGWWATKLLQSNETVRFGIFSIVFKEGGTIIKGIVTDTKFEHVSDIDHSTNVHHYLNKIIFDYSEYDRIDGDISGSCRYEFKNGKRLFGFVTRDQDSVKREIVGVKIAEPKSSAKVDLQVALRNESTFI